MSTLLNSAAGMARRGCLNLALSALGIASTIDLLLAKEGIELRLEEYNAATRRLMELHGGHAELLAAVDKTATELEALAHSL